MYSGTHWKLGLSCLVRGVWCLGRLRFALASDLVQYPTCFQHSSWGGMASPFGIKMIEIIPLLKQPSPLPIPLFYQLMWKYYRYFIIAVATLLFPGTDLTAILHSRAVCYCASKQAYLRNSAFTSSHSTPYETDTGSVKQSLHLIHRFRRQLCPLFSLSFQPVSNASLPSLPNAF